jgi:cytochrome c553
MQVARVFGCAALPAALLLTAAEAFAGGDIELGRYLASECMTCHRGAAPTSTIPNIFGLAETRLTTLIKAYRDKMLPNPVMQNIAGRLSDEDIASLALYFSQTRNP